MASEDSLSGSLLPLDPTPGSRQSATARYVDAPPPVQVAYAATVTLDANLGRYHLIAALTGNLTLNAPANGAVADSLVVEGLASGATRTVSLAAGSGTLPSNASGMVLPLQVGSGKAFWLNLRWASLAATPHWVLTSAVVEP